MLADALRRVVASRTQEARIGIMAKTRDLRVVSPEPAAGMGRRNVLRGLLTGAGAGLALPGLAETHPFAEHAHHASRMATAQTKALDSPGTPDFLDPYQFAMFETLSECIVPGAMVAGCARFVDSLLGVGERDDGERFLSALGAIDALARERFSSPWPEEEVLDARNPRGRAPRQPRGRGSGHDPRPVRHSEGLGRGLVLLLRSRAA